MERRWAAHAEANGPSGCLELSQWAGLPLTCSNFTTSEGTPGREKGPFQKHLQGATLDSSSVTIETHPWKLLQFQGNSYKQ